MFSIKTKIIGASVVIFSIVLISIAIAAVYDVWKISTKMLDIQLRQYSEVLIDEIQPIVENDSTIILDRNRILSIAENKSNIITYSMLWGKPVEFKGLKEIKIELFNSNGQPLLSDGLSKLHFWDNNKPTTYVNMYISNYKSDGVMHRCLFIPIQAKSSSTIVLGIATSMEDVISQVKDHVKYFAWVIPLILLAISLITYLTLKAAFAPVMSMISTVQKISAQNLTQRLPLPKAKDEIFRLGETLNEMVSRIENSFMSQKRFVADASHEFKTPLSIIQTELELLKKRIKNDEDNDSLDAALIEINRLTNLSNSLLMLSKLDAHSVELKRQWLRLDELLISCVQKIKKFAKESEVELHINISDPVEIYGDSEKLSLLFLNLLDNAIKYSNKFSEVWVEVKTSNNRVIITIQDSGIGILPEDLPHIFKRFYRSNEIRSSVHGSGLGLSIANEIVKMHDGSINVHSTQKEGTVFTVDLPLEEERDFSL